MHILFQISNLRLKQNAQRASVLNLAASGIIFFFQFVSLAILARLLPPADFGVFAMATPFVWILMTVGDLGLASALLQQRDLNEGEASAVFLVNLLAGFAFGGLFLLSSPLLGSLYGDPRVTQVAAALSFMFVFSGFTAERHAVLRRSSGVASCGGAEFHVRFFWLHGCARGPSPSSLIISCLVASADRLFFG